MCDSTRNREKGVVHLLDEIHKIIERENITSTQKILLIVIKVIPEGEPISLTDLTFYTSLSRQTVISNLKLLEDASLLQVTRNGTSTNLYKVIL